MSRRSTAAAALALVVVVLAAVGNGAAASAAAAGSRDAWRATRTLTRTHLVDGTSKVVDSATVTVRVDKTSELRGRERIHVSWSGAHPSGGRAANPFGEAGMAQEYPVVILQCRGLDDPKLPAAKRLSPNTCWTSTRQQRTQSATESQAVWRHDQYATDADRAQKSGVDPFPDAATCDDVDFLSTHVTPFVSANGETYASCTAETMAPEAAVGASYPPSEMAAFTREDGSGDAQFEVRTDVENESLGCSHEVACSLVVIPVMGISCIDDDPLCNTYGRFAPGSSNFANEGVDASVSPLYWWSASNWRNRFSVPLHFGLAPNVCDVLDSRAPTAFYGSELLSQAALQWAPAYCLRKDRFKFQHNRMSDAAAFALMANGQAPAALVSSRQPVEGGDPVAYAPTAVTGFAVSYVVDKPDNAGEETHLRLDARLLAKLLTQSYPASDLGRQHPGLEDNPTSINLDPEFRKLNPGLDEIPREAAATVMSLSQSSDVVRTLTAYIASDKDAAAFVAGKPDPWGMKVNPSYRGQHLPVSEWPLKDKFKPASDLECLKENPAVYLSQVAAPVSYLRTIAEAVLDGWPNVQTRCDRPTPTDPFKLGRVDRQGIGTRFLLGITSLGDAARFGLHTAELATTPGRFAGPTDASMSAALRHLTGGRGLTPFTLAQADLDKDPAAYPGTMVVYTAARRSGLAAADARNVASFIRISTTEGQRPGAGNGELPDGFLPIRDSGPTKPLFIRAQAAARVIARQQAATGTGPEGPLAAGSSDPSSGGVRGPSDAGAVPAAGSPEPADVPLAAPTVAAAAVTQAQTLTTAPQSSRLATALLPTALFLGLLGGLTSVALRLLTSPSRRTTKA